MQIDGERTETVTDFILGDSKITADGNCTHEIKRHLFLERKAMTNLDSILKSNFANISLSRQSNGFSSSHVWMWELDYAESCTLKNWCFIVLEKTLESPLDCKEIQPVHPKGNSVLNIHWKDWYWSWNSNTLHTWYEELTWWKRSWCWQKLKVGGEGEERGWDGWMASPTRWSWVWVNSGSSDGQRNLVCCSPWSCRVRHNWATKFNWTPIQ